MLHILTDILRNSILITGLVVVMMMMIESLNIESHGRIFRGLRRTRTGQVVVAALLGAVPGCMGGFATVSLYTHRMFSFGALVAMMIATSGDEAFVMLAMFPKEAMILTVILLVLAVIVGVLTDVIGDRLHRKRCSRHDHSECGATSDCTEGFAIHEEHHCHDGENTSGTSEETLRGTSKRHYGWKRIVMFIGLAVFIGALASGNLGHEHGTDGSHSHETCVHDDCGHDACSHGHEGHVHDGETFSINLLSEDWMNVMFAGLSVIVLIVLLSASDHFVEEHLWKHIIRKHLPTIFAWTFGILLCVCILLQYIDIESWISGNTFLMILLATAIGIIPESGPHLIFVTLYAAGIVPFPVLLASSISQDGHASLPLIAESKKSFLWAKAINCAVAIAAGLAAMLLM